ncbi:MAG: M56 family metallopeptidase, partial [Planctomycetota bacterium]
MNTLWDSVQSAAQWTLKTDLQAVLLVLMVGIITLVGGRWMTAGWRSVLWLVVFLRLAIPAAPASPLSVFNVFGAAEQTEIQEALPADDVAPGAPEWPHATLNGARPEPAREQPAREPGTATARHAGEAGSPIGRFVLSHCLTAIWLAGCLFLVLRLLWRACDLRLRIGRLPTVEDRGLNVLVGRCAARLGLRRAPRVVEAPLGSGPAIAGWLRPVLLLPRESIAQMSRAEMRLVLLHELRHVRCGDCALAWLIRLLVAVHWFNPLVWWAGRRWHADRELACDAWVLRHVGSRARRRYGLTLLAVVGSYSNPGPLASTTAMVAYPSLIERRIRAMKAHTHRPWLHGMCGAAVCVALVAVGLTDRAKAEKGPRLPEAATSPSAEDDGGDSTKAAPAAHVRMPATINGQVLDQQDKPVANAKVIVRVERCDPHGYRTGAAAPQPWTASTDDQGCYRFKTGAPWFGRDDVLSIKIRAEGFPELSTQYFGAGARSPLPVQRLPAGRTVLGRLVDPQGSPVAKAIVRFYASS